MSFAKANAYDADFVAANMMGPNSIVIIEELLQDVPLKRGMRVLDLGCGRGLTSIFLAKEFGVEVCAVDLWITARDNLERFREMRLADLITPYQVDAHALPFEDGYFHAIVSVDAYHYFGANTNYFKNDLKRLLANDGLIALAFPGMKSEIHDAIPPEMKDLWPEEALPMWQTADWWTTIFKVDVRQLEIKEMACFEKSWSDWLHTENPHAIEDREMIETDNGRYMNLISVTGMV